MKKWTRKTKKIRTIINLINRQDARDENVQKHDHSTLKKKRRTKRESEKKTKWRFTTSTDETGGQVPKTQDPLAAHFEEYHSSTVILTSLSIVLNALHAQTAAVSCPMEKFYSAPSTSLVCVAIVGHLVESMEFRGKERGVFVKFGGC